MDNLFVVADELILRIFMGSLVHKEKIHVYIVSEDYIAWVI